MKTVSKLENSQVAPRKVSALFCQVPVATVVMFNVCKAPTTQIDVEQKRD
jgi:hypothetical protein